MDKWPIGVFTSIDAGLGVHLEVAHELGIPTIQLHAPHKSSRTAEKATEFLARLSELKIELTAVFGGFEGESYVDIPTVEKTVGLVPSATRAERLQEMKEISDFAKLLQCNVIALHLGFVDHENEDYENVVAVARELCEHAKSNGQNLHLETGQETMDGLIRFINDVKCENLLVNFDPANMILYGTGEPIPALRGLGTLVQSVHCKDATWSDKPGDLWGEEKPLGDGDVNIRKYLEALNDIGYEGPLTIEREIPQDPKRQKEEIRHASELLSQIKSELFGQPAA